MKKLVAQLSLLSFIILTGCKGGGVITQSAAFNGGGSSTSASARWPSPNQNIPVKIASDGTGFSAGEVALIQAMGDAWETGAAGSNFFSYTGGVIANKQFANPLDYYDSEMGVYYHHTWFDPAQYSSHGISSSALAITQYFGIRSGDTFELTHADILVNGNFFFYTDLGLTNLQKSGRYDMASVILHEFGHFLGLGHNSAEVSVMRPTVSSGVNSERRTLQTADIRDIRARYGLGAAPQTAALESEYQALNIGDTAQGVHIRGVIELRADGKCVHRENGKVIHSHDVDVH